jgi:nucleoside-diphosphate-sugar epimerase
MRRYFLTGCTGWLGTFIVAELLRREDTASITCLTRREIASAGGKVFYHRGDITSTRFPEVCFTDIIHGANAAYHDPFTLDGYYAAVEGTRRVLELAERRCCALLFLSSGASRSADGLYGQAKRAAEMLLQHALRKAMIARIFTLVGEGIPEHYAIGRFIAQATREKKITVVGGGNVERSYLHAEDCARWLLTILDHGKALKPYDVGGDVPCRISHLAAMVGHIFGVPVQASGDSQPSSYLPDLKAAVALGCRQTINLSTALERIRDAARERAVPDLRHPDLQPAGASH